MLQNTQVHGLAVSLSGLFLVLFFAKGDFWKQKTATSSGILQLLHSAGIWRLIFFALI